MLLFQPPCSEAYNSRLSFRSKSIEQLNERRAGLSMKMGHLKYAGHSSFKHPEHSQAKVMKYCILAFTPIYCISHNIFLHLRQTILKKKTVCAPCGLLLWCCNAPFISSGSFGVTERKLWLYGSHSFSTF